MTIAPDYATFVAAYEAGRSQVVWRTLVADLETPVSAFLKLAHGQPYAFLLESASGHNLRQARLDRYSVVGFKPDLVWRCRGNVAEINRDIRIHSEEFTPCPVGQAGGALASLRALIAESRVDIPDALPPMAAGLFGYMAYDMVRLAERIPEPDKPGWDSTDIPDSIYIRPSVVAVFDRDQNSLTAVVPVFPRDSIDARTAYELAVERLDHVLDALERPLPASHDSADHASHAPTPEPGVTPAHYGRMVEKAQEYIAAGDIFQVVLSQRLSVPFRLPPFSLYRALRKTNPSPFLFYLNFGDFQLVGSSPEILVRLRDGKVTIRPIAGTRRRGKDEAEDEALAADLLADPKELAEHLMLLDLGRNDVGRVAEIGTVSVTSKMKVEYYSHVMHIVSNVEGVLRDDCDAMDALMAGFPAGTVSGAPKIRAMEIIDELEDERRGFYAGCIGYFAGNGAMDTCIALRTCLVKDGRMVVQAGAGIVADSLPASEHEECMKKAKVMLRVAEQALNYTQDGARTANTRLLKV
ncbi:MAG: anthranilate synthase component I [Magnetospirillum sp.]|nr:anthranilate synthase component I [Magnetospirillum sp.]